MASQSNQIHVRASQRDGSIFRLFRTNGDEIFVGGKPVHRVQSEIAIAIEIDEGVGRPRGAADNHEPALRVLFASVVRARRSDGHRTLFVLGIAGVDLWGVELFGGEARLGRAEKLLDRGLRVTLHLNGAREREGWSAAL